MIGRNDHAGRRLEGHESVRRCRFNGTLDPHRSCPGVAHEALGRPHAQQDRPQSLGNATIGKLGNQAQISKPNFFLELDWILQIGQLDLAQVSRDSQQQELMKGDDLRWKGGVKSKWATAVYEALTVNIWILFFVFKNISSDDTPAAFPASFPASFSSS